MVKHYTIKLLLSLILPAVFIVAKAKAQVKTSVELASRFILIRDTNTWKLVSSIPLKFPTYHPQGMVKIDDYFYMSSVEVINRGEGKGVGHLFKFNSTGTLVADVQLGEGAIYHPGGIDFDGKFIWVPVAEYRSHSRSIVYKVNSETLTKTEIFRFEDHLGGIVHDTQNNTLHGINWGSRLFYEWKLNSNGAIDIDDTTNKVLINTNPSFYIDYQDCHYLGNALALCGGVKNYNQGNHLVKLGGLELVNLHSHRPVFQIPVLLWSLTGRPMTQNPFWMETTMEGLRAYFVPDDDQSTLYIFDILVY